MATTLHGMDNGDGLALESGHIAERQRPGLPFSFNGKAGEYFGIWIVNILLSIVTLGIYSAWAKVRNKRYFYGNTNLNGSSFAYHASPLQILKGRLIAFAFFAAYAIVSSFFPALIGIFVIAIIILTPWVVVRSRAFNAFQSSYRNVRFGFTGGLWEAFKLYIVGPIAAFLSLGLALPYIAYLTDRFLVGNSSYGQTEMSFSGSPSAYYRIYGIAFLIAWPAALLILAFSALMIWTAIGSIGNQGALDAQMATLNDWFRPYAGFLPILLTLAIPLAIVASAYLTAKRQNYLFDSTKVGPHRLSLNLSFMRVLWIRFSNLVVIALSIGLMIPWARIRMARYQIEQMSLIPAGSLDTLVSDEKNRTAALGDEMGEGMDLDLGLGV
ncbi:MAG: YjgN family protein [Pseudomonadota bacterium]